VTNPMVSVVLAVYDERRHIEECLRTLRDQRYAPLEVIVVDDGSRDGTPQLVAERFPDVTLIRRDHLGAGSARNAGTAAARGEILVFVDGDMTFPPEFVERLVAPMLEEGAPGTFTKEILVNNVGRRWARAHQLGRGLPVDRHFRDDFPDRWENFRAVWRRDFERVGGFDEIGHGEDVTLGRKLGVEAHAAPGAVCWHYEPDTLVDIYRSARWYGRGERIRERPFPWRAYLPHRVLLRAARMGRRRGPALAVYKVVFDTGVAVGRATSGRRGGAAK
jgi:glycosyltransferase involved in cell wall biosynthesis